MDCTQKNDASRDESRERLKRAKTKLCCTNPIYFLQSSHFLVVIHKLGKFGLKKTSSTVKVTQNCQ